MALNPETLRNELVWRWRHFAVFSGPEWHRVLSLRTQIFVVEQVVRNQMAAMLESMAKAG